MLNFRINSDYIFNDEQDTDSVDSVWLTVEAALSCRAFTLIGLVVFSSSNWFYTSIDFENPTSREVGLLTDSNLSPKSCALYGSCFLSLFCQLNCDFCFSYSHSIPKSLPSYCRSNDSPTASINILCPWRVNLYENVSLLLQTVHFRSEKSRYVLTLPSQLWAARWRWLSFFPRAYYWKVQSWHLYRQGGISRCTASLSY